MILGAMNPGDKVVRIMEVSKEYRQNNRLPPPNDHILGREISGYVSRVLGSKVSPSTKEQFSAAVIDLAIEAGLYTGMFDGAPLNRITYFYENDIEILKKKIQQDKTICETTINQMKQRLQNKSKFYGQKIEQLNLKVLENETLLHEVEIIAERIFLHARSIGLTLSFPINGSIEKEVKEREEEITEDNSDKMIGEIFEMELPTPEPGVVKEEEPKEIARVSSYDSNIEARTDVESEPVSAAPSPFGVRIERPAGSHSMRSDSFESSMPTDEKVGCLTSPLFKTIPIINVNSFNSYEEGNRLSTDSSPSLSKDMEEEPFEEKKRMAWVNVPKNPRSMLSLEIKYPVLRRQPKENTERLSLSSSAPSKVMLARFVLQAKEKSVPLSTEKYTSFLIQWAINTSGKHQRNDVLPVSGPISSRFTKVPKEMLYVAEVLRGLDSSLLPKGDAKEVIDLAITAGNLVSESNPSDDYPDEVQELRKGRLKDLKSKISPDSEWFKGIKIIEAKIASYYSEKTRLGFDDIFPLEI